MLYNNILMRALAVGIMLVVICLCLDLCVFEKKKNLSNKQLLFRFAAMVCAFFMLILTYGILTSRVVSTTFYVDEYNIVDMADERGMTKYHEIPETERERFIIENLGNGERAAIYLHQDTIEALEDRNAHVGYERFKK